MAQNAHLLLVFGYPIDIVDLIPDSVIVNPPGGKSGTYHLTSARFGSAGEAFGVMSPAITAGLKVKWESAPPLFEVMRPDFERGRLTENELELTPAELEVWLRGGRTGEPPWEEAVEPAFLSIDSTPAGGRVFIDNIDTGQNTWIVRIEVSPGEHNIKVSGIEGYVETQATMTAIAGQTVSLNIPMAPTPTEEIPEPTPTPTPTEPAPFTPFAQLLQHVLGEVPEWWKPIDDFSRWATDTFGLDFGRTLSAEDRAKFEELGISTKILFIGGPMSIQQVGATTAGKTLTQMTAGEIKALARTDPGAIRVAWNKMPASIRLGLHTILQKTPLGQEASDAIFSITGPALQQQGIARLTDTISAIWKPIAFVGALVGLKEAVSWFHKELPEVIGFPLRDLVRDEKWEEAARILPVYKNLVGIATTFFRNTGFEALLGLPIWQGYADAYDAQVSVWEKEISEGLAAGQPDTSITVNTNEDPALASIAAIFLQKTTPFTINIAPGSYDLTVEKEGFKPRTVRIFPKEGTNTPVTVDLDPISPEITPRAGRLEIAAYDKKTNTPALASFFVNDRLEKATAHAIALDMVPGAYEIRVEAFGFKVWTDTVLVEEGVDTKVRAELEKPAITPPEIPPEEPPLGQIPPEEPQKGRLEVSANTQAQIFIGGTDSGFKTPHSFDLTQGIYSVTLEAKGFISRSTTTLIKAGETSNVSLELQATDAPLVTQKLAKVSIQSEPSSAKILVNGVWTKKYTPDSVLLEAGDYEIALSKSGFKTWRTPLRLEEET
ncbi:hypothetical protein LCGC14_0900750 [marine sediment metagenome]|uniref:PEGA domain-containing protein n=1 Tax=marine sediment metagenome TaxID=412755 RepID=A0A0F9NWH7_9ZZZZ